jgi:hypothetical protein
VDNLGHVGQHADRDTHDPEKLEDGRLAHPIPIPPSQRRSPA